MVFIDFRGFGKILGFEKSNKLMKIGLERLREAKNEAKRDPGRLRERKMSQHEAPRRLQEAFKGARSSLTNGRML